MWKPEGVGGPGDEAPAAQTVEGRLALSGLFAASKPGVHHHLGRAESGLMLFGQSRDGNRSLARAFEGKRVIGSVLVGVEGWPAKAKEKVIRGQLDSSRRRGGKNRRAKGRPVELKVRVVKRVAERTLLEVKTGRINLRLICQVLADAGYPVAGDNERGGPAAWRLVAELSGLGIRPGEGEAERAWQVPPSPGIQAWLRHGGLGVALSDAELLGPVLDEAMQRRWPLIGAEDQEGGDGAFRWVHREADGVRGLGLDVYGDHLVVHLYESLDEEGEETLLELLSGYGFESVYLKRRPKQANDIVDAKAANLSPSEPVRGGGDTLTSVVEHGVRYPVALGDGLSTGIFLDQRENRRRVKALASGKEVLNLFAYTGAFSIAAAAGGAVLTVSVDASRSALERAETALEGMPGEHRFSREDVFAFLRGTRQFDLVLLDPPTYSKVGDRRWRSGAQWEELAAMALGAVRRGGALLACSNDSRMSGAAFHRRLLKAAESAGRSVERIEAGGLDFDFPPHPVRGAHLKSIWLEVG